jgi:hypothetical protein
MSNLNYPRNKQEQLIALYKIIANEGYEREDGRFISFAFSDMEIRAFKQPVKKIFENLSINTLLDYGCGASNYENKGFAGELSAKKFFNLSEVFLYEPARNIDQRFQADAVVCFDVLEHVFISEVPKVIRELFSLANKLLIINVACYPAKALLPNGENAHITVRPPLWWKGMFDSIAVEFPDIAVQLWCSTDWRKVEAYKLIKASEWQEQDGFVVPFA